MSKLRIKTKYLSLIFLLIISCNSFIEIDNFSSEEWKSDRNGCLKIRESMAQSILAQKNQLLGQSEHSILKLLGRPDKNELYRRQQKFYIYYIEPGPLCKETSQASQASQASDFATYLSLRFNATGVVKEVFIYEK